MKNDIKAARQHIKGYLRQTPVMDLTLGGHAVEIKLEHLQVSGAFKARGAFNNVLSANIPPAGVVAASGGNHGAAVAIAAVKLGHKAKVFVPEIAGNTKIRVIKETGADCVVVPGSYKNALAAAVDYENETGAVQLHAFDAPATVHGQGTLFAEWEDQGLDADTILIAVGGGGLIAGALGWFEGRKKIVAVEPVNAPTLHAALETGPDTQVEVGGIAASALGAPRIGKIAFDMVQKYGVTNVLVDDDAIRSAQILLWNELRQVVEPGGATALAALISGAYQPEPGEKVAVLVCGANIGHDPLDA